MSRMCTPTYCIPLYGSIAVVLMWTTREGGKTTCWVRDILDNVWIVIRSEREDD